jgi:hypothetical protein
MYSCTYVVVCVCICKSSTHPQYRNLSLLSSPLLSYSSELLLHRYPRHSPRHSPRQSHLVEQSSSVKQTWSAPGLPKFTGAHAPLGQAVAYILRSINQLQADAERDNKFVYFQQIPGPLGGSSGVPLPELPPEASLMNPVPYQQPNRAGPAVPLVYVAKPSFFGSMVHSISASFAAAKPAAGDDAAVAGGGEGASSSSSSASPSAAPVPVPVPPPAPAAAGAGVASAPPMPPPPPQQQQYQYQQQQYTYNSAAPPAPAPSAAPAGPRYNSLV